MHPDNGMLGLRPLRRCPSSLGLVHQDYFYRNSTNIANTKAEIKSPQPAERQNGSMSVDFDELRRLRRARDKMDREYATPLDVPAMARTALMSTAHFSRRFREAYSETPYSYLRSEERRVGK